MSQLDLSKLADCVRSMGGVIVHLCLTTGTCAPAALEAHGFDRDLIAAFGSLAQAYAEAELPKRRAALLTEGR